MNETDTSIGNALVVSSVASILDQFCSKDIELLQSKYKVSVAANFRSGNNTSKTRVNEYKEFLSYLGVVVYDINFARNPFAIRNIGAFMRMKKMIRDGKYSLIHCHSPVGAFITRLAAWTVPNNSTKIIYTAHGFHFYSGAPIINWLIFFPIELVLSRVTDVIITINREDYERSTQSLRARKNVYIPGIGIDIKKIDSIKVDATKKREELDVPADCFVIVSVGELNKNKNHETVIRAISKIKTEKIYYLICGQGILKDHLQGIVKDLGLERRVRFLGFRKDIIEIHKASNLFILPSYREGLSVALMEAMAAGLPVVCSRIRGNVDLIKNEKGGFLVKANDFNGYSTAIKRIIDDAVFALEMGRFNNFFIQQFDREKVHNKMLDIYNS